MLVELSKGTLLALHLGRMKDEGRLAPEQVSLGKLNNVREALAIARTARTILGANGVTLEYPVIRHANNLESVLTYEGTSEVHSLILGQAVTGLAAFTRRGRRPRPRPETRSCSPRCSTGTGGSYLVHCYRAAGSSRGTEDLPPGDLREGLARRRPGRAPAGSPRAWLYRIATNACLDVARRRGRRRVLPYRRHADPVARGADAGGSRTSCGSEPFPEPGCWATSTLVTVVQRETIELAFLAALQHLPPGSGRRSSPGTVLGWSARATATLLGTSEVSVKSALQRARAT